MQQIDFIRNQAIFKDLSSEELEVVAHFLQLQNYKVGEYIIRENELSQDIYFIKNGEAEVVKKNPATKQEFIIGKLQEGDLIGEIAFIDGQPRSSSIRVSNYPASVYKLPVDYSNSLLSPIYNKIFEKAAQVGLSHLRTVNREYIQNLKQQIQETEEQNQFGYFFIFIVTTYNLSMVAQRVLLDFDVFQEKNWISIISFSLLLLLPTAIFIRYMNYSFANFGVTLHGLIPTLKNTCFIACGGLLLAGTIYYVIAPTLFFSYLSQISTSFFHWNTLVILFYAFSNEFAIRGVTQTSLQKFLFSQQKEKAILLTSLILWPTNLHWGFQISFIKFLVDLFLGALFVKQKNLIGVVLIHFLIAMLTLYSWLF